MTITEQAKQALVKENEAKLIEASKTVLRELERTKKSIAKYEEILRDLDGGSMELYSEMFVR